MNNSSCSQGPKLGLVQMAMSTDSKQNVNKAVRMIRDAVQRGANIICLPELFTSPYFCNIPDASFDYAEEIPGPTTEVLSNLARELQVAIVGGSLHERSGDKFYNTSCLFDSTGELLGTYRKTHIPHDECFFEKFYFSPGDTGFKVFQSAKIKLASLICYDQWFPEAARSVALMGAEVIFYPTAIATVDHLPQVEGDWQTAWENVMRGHAIANCLIVAAVNRVGVEGGSRFWGGSFVCDAFGRTLVRAGADEEVLVKEINLDHSQQVREGWRFFYNRRPECYGRIVE